MRTIIKNTLHNLFQPLRRIMGVETRLVELENRTKSLEGQVAFLTTQLQEEKRQLALLEHDLKMPKYMYHVPLDYEIESYAPSYDEAIFLPEESLPIPPSSCRAGYSEEDTQYYLAWGKYDHDFIVNLIRQHYELRENLKILDFGCSSGRVLRHFYQEMKSLNWKLNGIDIQAFLIEWMRQNFPPEITVFSSSTFPHLPFEDSSLDVIYGISVFSHTKYLWDGWLAEFKRVLKPGGLCLQTVQCETAWKFYHENRHLNWVQKAHPKKMLETSEMEKEFFFYGDGMVSQTFYQEEIVKKYWGRYLQVVDFLDPPQFSYQNWIVLKNN